MTNYAMRHRIKRSYKSANVRSNIHDRQCDVSKKNVIINNGRENGEIKAIPCDSSIMRVRLLTHTRLIIIHDPRESTNTIRNGKKICARSSNVSNFVKESHLQTDLDVSFPLCFIASQLLLRSCLYEGGSVYDLVISCPARSQA